ncbi:FG-GAP repeat domain-containing protein [Saccharothrix australiensis]|uniref:VCBS repeat protein n=1 Tax=Saccharothrix australiensis TaxID=2072 RepID=A0A495VXI6_9PSEU|nr:VCBS repeat-containing protein [Saccharothrix australiensis]RKT54132.1 VCBS repeat protein [Saccharothrix australiensis]
MPVCLCHSSLALSSKWSSYEGGWDSGRSRYLSGDYNGDGRTDVAASFDYGNGQTGVFVWEGKADGFSDATRRWLSNPGGWNANQTRFMSGDYTGDGRADIGAFYDYGNASTSLFVMEATPGGFTNPATRWSSNPGGWDIARTITF